MFDVTRLIAQRMGESMGQAVLVENQAGAGGLLLVASSPQELADAVKRDIAVVANIVKRAKIEPE